MAELLKNIYFTRSSMDNFAQIIKQVFRDFDELEFLRLIFSDEWESKEFKERMRHTTLCLHKTLPGDYLSAIAFLKEAAPLIKGAEAMSLPDYVELFGIEYWDASMAALKCFTRYSSSEFGIRPFLDREPQRGMAVMVTWAGDPDPKVRRLASEGCRPRLPWGMALPGFKKDPTLIFPVLEKLKNDENDSVRRSVANNLNDISKDNPDLALATCERWHGQSARTDEIVKHACRGLLKAGNKRALLLFGFGDPTKMTINDFALEEDTLRIGQETRFSFQLVMSEKVKRKVRLEYKVYYMKANGKLSPKVFQIIEKVYEPGSHKLTRKQTFQNMTTRKHYPGEHFIAILVNGEEKAKLPLQLLS